MKQNKNPKFKKSHNLLIEHVKLSFDLCKRLKFNHFLHFFYKVPVELACAVESYVDCLIALDYVKRNHADILLYSGEDKKN